MTPPRIVLESAPYGRWWELPSPVTAGRAQDCDLRLEFREISRLHFEIAHLAEGGWHARNLSSVRGTLLNGVSLSDQQWQRLHPGDVLQPGDQLMTVVRFVVTDADGWDACRHPASMLASLPLVDWSQPWLDRAVRLWGVDCLARRPGMSDGATKLIDGVLAVSAERAGFAAKKEQTTRYLMPACRATVSLRAIMAGQIPDAVCRSLTIADDPRAGRIARDALQADLLRCALGNPWRTPSVPRHWATANDGAAERLAGLVAAGDAGATPVLADALEDAGCDDEVLLRHLREGPHGSCCRVVEALLGREFRLAT